MMPKKAVPPKQALGKCERGLTDIISMATALPF